MTKLSLLSAVAGACLFAASAASAANYDITSVGFDGGTAALTGTINGSAYFDNALTGLITLTTSGGQVIPVFCIDLFHSINLGSYNPALPYTTATITVDSSTGASGVGGNPLAAPIPGEIQALANLGYAHYANGTGSSDIYEALQGAIWTIEYNANGNNLAVDGGGTVNSLITSYIAYAEAHPALYSQSLIPGANGQAFGYGQGFASGVPEPSTWAMLLLGFAGLGFAGWRRASVKSESLAG